jgi:hypothetical protein
LLLAAVCLAAPGDSAGIPPAARPAIKKYELAVATADAERARAVDKARGQLVTDLKDAQKTALQNNDVDGATAVAQLAKRHAAAGGGGDRITQALLAKVWGVGAARLRFSADGTYEHSEPVHKGTWSVIGDRTVALFHTDGHIEVWRFDEAAKTFRGSIFNKDHDYDGFAAR